MITRMKKLMLLVYHKEYSAFLQRLRDIGVVHVVERGKGALGDSGVERQLALAGRYTRAIKRLESMASGTLLPAGDTTASSELLERYENIIANIEQERTVLQVIEKDIAAMEPWGDFDFSLIGKLEKAGYAIDFFVTGTKAYDKEWETKYNAIVVAENAARLYFVTVTHAGTKFELDAENAKLPTASLSVLNNEKENVERRLDEYHKELARMAEESLNTLRAAHETLMHEIEFSKVALGGEKVLGDKLILLEGWVPEDNVSELKSMLDSTGAFYELRDAQRGDNAPVKLRNNAFTRMYEVLTKMYGMPSGTDFDPTPIVAPFFSLFFAFCMGDAGYGLVLILLGFLLKRKMKDELRGMMNLVITLGIFTTVIGALLGTFFGISLLGTGLPEEFKKFIFAGNIELFGSTYDKQMILALAIGVVHISIAMTVKAINNTVFFGFKESLSAWGWWLVVVGGVVMGTLSLLSIIPAEVSKLAFIIIGIVGAIGIYILNTWRWNIFANIGVGIWDTYNMASGLLGDVLSYIRLFALGLAGGMLGQTFNSLAMMVVDGQEGIGAVFGWIGFGLIIIFGHVLNIAMSCLSAFVHPLRLTFVEYFKNAGYDGKGVEYKPFKNK